MAIAHVTVIIIEWHTDLALVIWGSFPVDIHDWLEIIRTFWDEQQQVILQITTEDLLGRFLGELDDSWQLVGNYKFFDLVSC